MLRRCSPAPAWLSSSSRCSARRSSGVSCTSGNLSTAGGGFRPEAGLGVLLAGPTQLPVDVQPPGRGLLFALRQRGSPAVPLGLRAGAHLVGAADGAVRRAD